MIFSPADYDTLENFSKVRSKLEQRIGAMGKVLERRYRIQIDFLESVHLEKAHATKYEVESRENTLTGRQILLILVLNIFKGTKFIQNHEKDMDQSYLINLFSFLRSSRNLTRNTEITTL